MAPEDPIDALLAGVGPGPDDERAAASAETRSRRRLLRQQAAESATMAGILLTLAEREIPVTVRAGPWAHRGRLRSVTAALTVISLPDGLGLIPTVALTAVEAPVAVTDDRPLGPGPDLAAVLAMVAPEHPPVRLLLSDGTEVTGSLGDLGKDVACVRLTSAVASVRLSALAGCVLLAPETAQDEDSDAAFVSLDDFGSG